jgi:hypothetical protein
MVSDRVRSAVTLVGAVESLTVITIVFVPAAVGVPLITPVEASNASVEGRPVADHV